MKEEVEEENKMICVQDKDDFVLKQDICVMCGSLGNDSEGRLIVCTQCGQCYHPHCVNVRVTKVILEKGWRCLDCTVCEGCGLKHDEPNLLLCDECDISFHIYCMDPPLDHVPQGTWKCKWCAQCQTCGTNDPGFNSPWYESFSLCGPCHSLQMCLICEDGYEDDELIIQCGTCNRWCHGECDSIQTEDDAEKCAEAGYSCPLCRPPDVLPPHLALSAEENANKKSCELQPSKRVLSPPCSPEYNYASSHYSSNSFVVDGIVLSERGMVQLKSQTVEKEKTRRRRRGGDRAMFDSIETVVAGGENDEEEDDDLMPPPTPGGPPASGGPKDGDRVWPLADGKPPEAPEGFTVVVKDNGLMVLRKRRYRDLKKVGIGGFQAKTRTPKMSKTKEEPEADANGDKPKRRPAWRPKKNKILVQYPEYIQDSFFGREFIDSTNEVEDDPLLDLSEEDEFDSALNNDKNKSHNSDIILGRDALRAVEELKAKEEEELKEKEAKLKAEQEAAAAAASAKKEEQKEGDEKEKTEDEGDLNLDPDLLPNDLFGDDFFSSVMDGDPANAEIDEAALEEAEKEDNKADDNKKGDSALAAALQDTIGFKLNSKDMEDIFNDMIEDEESKDETKVKDEVKTENEEKPSTVEDNKPPIVQSNQIIPQSIDQPPQIDQEQQQQPIIQQQPQQQIHSVPTPPVQQQQPQQIIMNQQQQQQMPQQSQVMMVQLQQQQRPELLQQQQQQQVIQQQQIVQQQVVQRPIMNQQQQPQQQQMLQQQQLQQQQVRQQQMLQQQQQVRQQQMLQQQQMQQQQQQIVRPQQQQQQQIIRSQIPPQQQQQQQQFNQGPPVGARFSNAPSPYHQTDYSQNSPMPSPAFSSDSQNSWTNDPQQSPRPQHGIPPPPGAVPEPPVVVAAPPPQQSNQKTQLLKWESDEPLGEQATIAMILYANKNHPNLKSDYPQWPDRIKQIAKIWKNLPNDKRIPYVQQARENRTANRMNRTVILIYFIFTLFK